MILQSVSPDIIYFQNSRPINLNAHRHLHLVATKLSPPQTEFIPVFQLISSKHISLVIHVCTYHSLLSILQAMLCKITLIY